MTSGSLKTLLLPNGKNTQIDFSGDHVMELIEERVLEPCRDFFSVAWLAYDKEDEFCGELRIKRLLGAIASYLIHYRCPEPEVITEWGERRNKERETTLDDGLAKQIADDFQAEDAGVMRRRRNTQEPIIERIAREKKREKLKKLSWRIVDTEGAFDYDGIPFHVLHPAYEGYAVSGDVSYDLDRIVVGENAIGCLSFYTQGLTPIHGDYITSDRWRLSGYEETARAG